MSSDRRQAWQAGVRHFGPGVFRRLLPDAVIQRIARQYGEDERERKLPTRVQLWLLVLAQLDGGVRGLDDLLRKAWEPWRTALGLAPGTTAADKSALSRQNTGRPAAVFRELFGWLVAACHGCAVLPETSCEEGNRVLDRGMVVGRPDFPELGLFGGFVASALMCT